MRVVKNIILEDNYEKEDLSNNQIQTVSLAPVNETALRYKLSIEEAIEWQKWAVKRFDQIIYERRIAEIEHFYTDIV